MVPDIRKDFVNSYVIIQFPEEAYAPNKFIIIEDTMIGTIFL